MAMIKYRSHRIQFLLTLESDGNGLRGENGRRAVYLDFHELRL